ncbi:MAG TPA: tRNA (adenosine(37)-N6)-threonylcarbamoyltransferase complex dimerization subunit type 1 TsaB [Ktedonobacteraceae bacterium]|jgi:tRNA threonylcarbamoyladenosine biosynthesis protein TsaB|nr:tRNA (adenosine(37)-N6)-threonylcarbamoyltransferase complex dimerization subunit type 1 TsaB [Ktedonobacteraceae bacterium]
MLLLALDTSTRQASVALCDEERLYGEYTWHVGNNHSVELLERVQRLLAEGGVGMSALDGLAVATGPGSFNGVRVAVATAKALAFAMRKPLVGISTLEMCAAQHQQWAGPVCSLLEAGRSELYAACYLFEGQESAGVLTYRSRQLGDYQVLAPHDLALYLQEQISPLVGIEGEAQTSPYLFCGEISEDSRLALTTSMKDRAFFAPVIASVRRASILACLARQRLAENSVDDPLLLEPLYLRRPSITTSTRKRPLLGRNFSSSDQQSTEREEGALRH